MGLLDNLDFNDPKTMGLLNMGLGILAGNTGRPGDMGQGLMGGMQNYQQMMQQQQLAALRKQQQDMQTQEFGWKKQQYEDERNEPYKVGNTLLDKKTLKPLFTDAASASKYGMAPRIGINPTSKRPEYVQFSDAGQTQWTGISPTQDEIAIAEAQDKGVLPMDYPYRVGGNSMPSGAGFTWSGPTATDIKEGTSPNMQLRDPATPNLPPASQRKIAEKQAESQIMSPLDQASLTEKEVDLSQNQQKKQQAIEYKKNIGKVVEEKLDDVMNRVDGFSAGFGGSILGKIPATDAYDLSADIDTIKANFGFDRLQAMRDLSPTGGALGQVAVQELSMLQASIANLDTSQSPAQLKKNLEKAKTHYRNWLETIDGGVILPKGAKMPGAEQPATRSKADILKQYGVR